MSTDTGDLGRDATIQNRKIFISHQEIANVTTNQIPIIENQITGIFYESHICKEVSCLKALWKIQRKIYLSLIKS